LQNRFKTKKRECERETKYLVKACQNRVNAVFEKIFFKKTSTQVLLVFSELSLEEQKNIVYFFWKIFEFWTSDCRSFSENLPVACYKFPE